MRSCRTRNYHQTSASYICQRSNRFLRSVHRVDRPNRCRQLLLQTDRFKIQTANPKSYRKLVHFLREEGAESHTYQLKEDKPTRAVIRNLHPATSTDLIKTELEMRLFELQTSNSSSS